MNHLYRSIWSDALGCWIAVSENIKSKTKRSNTRKALLMTGLLMCATPSWALPTGQQVVAGLVNINVPGSGHMEIQQNSQKAIANWQGFSIAVNESVNIHQANANAALLNRVVGQDASQIQGKLNANGQVYIVNPNGVIFGKTAQVDVGGLVASTHNISNSDFMNGNNHFTQNGATGSVENHGLINTQEGGVVALIGEQVSNTGTINTPKGTTALAAGKTVDLDFQGDGLLEVKVSEAALNAQIANKGAIQADGGRVLLTAKAAGKLIDTVINQDGIVQAQGMVARNGAIILDAGNNGAVSVSGTLDVSSQLTGGNITVTGEKIHVQNQAIVTASGNFSGGHIVIGDQQTSSESNIQQGATVSSQARTQGQAGKIDVFANMNTGVVRVDGQLDASTPRQGNGGVIDTSAAHVNISNSAKITTRATHGKTGTWIIDPPDFTIAASGGDMTGTALSNALASNSVSITSSSGASGINGDININDVVSWSANLLTLIAEHDININANLNGSGTAQLALLYGQATASGATSDGYSVNNGAKITLAAGANFSTTKGSEGKSVQYTVDTSIGEVLFYTDGQRVDINESSSESGSRIRTKNENVAGLVTGVTGHNSPNSPDSPNGDNVLKDTHRDEGNNFHEPHHLKSGEFGDIERVSDARLSYKDTVDEGADNARSPHPGSHWPLYFPVQEEKPLVVPVLQIENSAGRVLRLKLSKNKKFLSLLLEDGSVRVWDFQNGVQRNIIDANNSQKLTDVSTVDNSERLSVASKAGIESYDLIGSVPEKLSINDTDIKQFVSSNDGLLLLASKDGKNLSLWDNRLNRELWRLPNKRGMVNNLTLSDDRRYAAVLSRQEGVYVYDLAAGKAKPLTDAVDIIDLATGKVSKSLPNLGEDVVYTRFNDNGNLWIGLADGKMVDWSSATDSQKTLVRFPETLHAIDQDKDSYAYITKKGAIHIGNGYDDRQLNIQNPFNPVTDVKLLDDKKLLTVMASGDLAVWDTITGSRILRLFSTKQGWTVMDAYGRFDGSDEAMENFNWIADEEAIPLDSFSENYYEPGLLASALQKQNYINSNPDRVKDGISLPPKVDLQLADRQTQGDKVAVQLNVYDRGGGINTIKIFHNDRLARNEDIIIADQTLQDNNGSHRALSLNITPDSGENTLKVIASNDMGIENSRSEIHFDGKTKAYESFVRLMSVGINDYQERALKLKYSVPDAELIDEVLKQHSKLIASTKLINKDATKAQILAELKDISQGSQQDVLVIYFAGHGVAQGKEWYFMPYETRLTSRLDEIVKAGISATELSDIFKKSKIQHIMLMVDSCYSGAGMDAFSTLENGQRYFSRQLSRSLGITVVTAATKDQEAHEESSLGHGLFTYLMAQELTRKDHSQPVTAHGVAKSIMKSLPVFSKKMGGASQEPVVYTKGNDFMLTDLANDKK